MSPIHPMILGDRKTKKLNVCIVLLIFYFFLNSTNIIAMIRTLLFCIYISEGDENRSFTSYVVIQMNLF